jgi:hypothetical protein
MGSSLFLFLVALHAAVRRISRATLTRKCKKCKIKVAETVCAALRFPRYFRGWRGVRPPVRWAE